MKRANLRRKVDHKKYEKLLVNYSNCIKNKEKTTYELPKFLPPITDYAYDPEKDIWIHKTKSVPHNMILDKELNVIVTQISYFNHKPPPPVYKPIKNTKGLFVFDTKNNIFLDPSKIEKNDKTNYFSLIPRDIVSIILKQLFTEKISYEEMNIITYFLCLTRVCKLFYNVVHKDYPGELLRCLGRYVLSKNHTPNYFINLPNYMKLAISESSIKTGINLSRFDITYLTIVVKKMNNILDQIKLLYLEKQPVKKNIGLQYLINVYQILNSLIEKELDEIIVSFPMAQELSKIGFTMYTSVDVDIAEYVEEGSRGIVNFPLSALVDSYKIYKFSDEIYVKDVVSEQKCNIKNIITPTYNLGKKLEDIESKIDEDEHNILSIYPYLKIKDIISGVYDEMLLQSYDIFDIELKEPSEEEEDEEEDEDDEEEI